MLEPVTPAVVNISVISRSPEENNPLARDPFFRQFFGLRSPEPQLSAGSGVIVNAKSGQVVTNHHVIKDATQVFVVLKDNRRFQAKVIGSDAATDVALLSIPPDGLTEAKLGDSDALRVGDFVLAIGNPFGIGQTVTSGIVSALGRSGLLPEGYEDFIQTDASINPGNSGGALINMKGELVGINTAILGPTGGNVGIGFAVPVNIVRYVMAQLLRFGEVKRGWLGIGTQDLTPDLAKSLGVQSRMGAVIAQVQPDSPAAAAGLREGDVVVEAGGRPIRGSADLHNRLGLTSIGDTLEFRVARGPEERRVKVRIAEVPTPAGGVVENIPQLAGASIANAERAAGGAKVPVILVTKVQAGSAAYRIGLRAGDLIIGANNRRVGTIVELGAALRGGGRMTLNLLRGDFQLTITVR
ncbi:MAG: Do family serine endopeptidase [Proteobacteria bacterium]|nr:Do family serine endopeptidase [Pseudomonadota bacterium]